jgi:hypothetical protein
MDDPQDEAGIDPPSLRRGQRACGPGEDEKDNMAYIQPTPSTLDLIRDEKERRSGVES